MAHSILLGTLVDRAKQRANQVGSDAIETPEWKEIISEHYGDLHSAAAEVGARYHETEATISLSTFALPTDHLSTIGVDFVYDAAGRRRPLAELMVQEVPFASGITGDAYLFSLVGGLVKLFPTPSTGTYKHIYVPQPTDYSASSDATSVDVINIHGLKYIIWGTASVALHREESAQQRAIQERDKALEQFTTWAINRALTMPKRRVITDVDMHTVRNNPYWWTWWQP